MSSGNACSVGTDMLELDCHITKDGHVVVSHDNDLQRTTGHQLLISQTLYKDLPLLKSSLRPEFACGVISSEIIVSFDRCLL
ncbi:hypothetical protein NP493_1707g00001 [Ridgeia piscesae]|uniref:GP-PDE domain-containing protein n=1 Tax=Ridgeia piscesae TaxID=27915 RepID=A0AAD9JVQ8_RIDPI|nr:hypothetical protein NP493_1707g00001 [Ridgeia piscesae]